MQEAKVTLEIMPTSEKTIIFDNPDAPFNRKAITNHILKQKQKFMLYLHTTNKSFRVPERMVDTGITDSWFIALDCFGVQQYPATILFASIAIEALLNHDKRLYDYKRSKKGWIYLNLENLKVASEKEIDISYLLDRNGKDSEFIKRRNKIAHGDLAGYFNFLWKEKPNRELIEKIEITRKQALNQLNRSFRFITTWAKSEPTMILEGIEEIH